MGRLTQRLAPRLARLFAPAALLLPCGPPAVEAGPVDGILQALTCIPGSQIPVSACPVQGCACREGLREEVGALQRAGLPPAAVLRELERRHGAAVRRSASPDEPGERRDGRGVGWSQSWHEAFRDAAARRVPVLVHVFADWSPESRYVTAHVLSDPEVVAAIEAGYVPLQYAYDDVNYLALRRRGADLDAQTRRFLSGLKVSALPLFAVYDPDGTETRRMASTVDTTALLYFLREPTARTPEAAAAALAAARRSGRSTLLYLYDSTPFGAGVCSGSGVASPVVSDVAVRILAARAGSALNVLLVDLRYGRFETLPAALGIETMAGLQTIVLFDRTGRERTRLRGTILARDLEAALASLSAAPARAEHAAVPLQR